MECSGRHIVCAVPAKGLSQSMRKRAKPAQANPRNLRVLKMWKATGSLALVIFAVHFYMLARTGHIDPCDAAFAKIEYDNIGYFKSKRRELVPLDEEQQQLYDYINQRDILQCYKIALF